MFELVIFITNQNLNWAHDNNNIYIPPEVGQKGRLVSKKAFIGSKVKKAVERMMSEQVYNTLV